MTTAATEMDDAVLPQLDGVMAQWLKDHPVNEDDKLVVREHGEGEQIDTVYDAILTDNKARESLPIIDLMENKQRLDDEADAKTLYDGTDIADVVPDFSKPEAAVAGPGPDRYGPERPSEVWVGAKRYSIEYDHDKLMIHCGENRKDLLGVSNHQHQRILIDDASAEQTIRDTLWHEILHCIWWDAHMNDLEMNQEDIIGLLTPRTILMMRVNPDVMSYVLREA